MSFGFFERHAGNEYTFYAIDLPFHGQTNWANDLPFTAIDLEKIVTEILRQENSSFSVNPTKLTLVGYSLGARIVLSLYQSQPLIADKLVLFAPDGLKINFWYWVSTQTWVGNKLFAFTMEYPGWFFGFLKALNKLNLANASIFKFVNYYIGDKEVRRLLYARWTTLRKLKPGLKKIKSLVKDNKTKVRLVYGKHDRIILTAVGEKFRKGIEEHCTISVIYSGHQVLHEKHVQDLLPALLH